MLSFLLASWKILVPALLVLALGIDDGVQRIKVANRNATISDAAAKQAQEIAAAEAQVRAAMTADQELANKLVGDYAAEIATLQGNLADALSRQAAVPSTPQCDHSPAAAIFDRSLRGLAPDQAGAVQPKPAR